MDSWFDAVGTWLFKYPPRAFARGELVVAPVLPVAVLAGLAGTLLALMVVRHAQLRTLPWRDRGVLAALRTALVGTVLACLLRPGLVTAAAVPQRNVLALLFDDSRSMRIADAAPRGTDRDTTRLAAVQAAFADTGALRRRLAARFSLRVFRFAADATPMPPGSVLLGTGTRTDLAQALTSVRDALGGLPLAGIVLVTDGGDHADHRLDDALLSLTARRVPVFTVGVGRERFDRDVAIERVEAPHSTLRGGTTIIEADVRVRGAGRTPVTVVAEADGRVVARESVRPADGADLVTARLRLPPLAAGTHRLAVRGRPLAGERVPENNAWESSLDVRPGPERILYVEGEPRPEFAFLRRALAGDSGVQVVGLMRSADRKFLRLGVRDSLELLGGFPTSREELYQYRALILGSVEAAFFTTDQLRMLADFVSLRGGALLVLGGRASLSEGGYAGTPLADVLPLTLEPGSVNTEGPAVTVRIGPTRAAARHPALQLGETPEASRARWDSLPALTMVNRLGALRRGATLLLAGRTDDGRRDVPILSWHRYGRGVGAVLGVQDTWLWRMDAAMPVEDRTHETLWRQLARWLVDEVPTPFTVTVTPARVAPQEPVTIRAQVSTPRFAPINDALVTATLIAPDGTTQPVPLEWTLRDDGSYVARVTPADTGRYQLATTAVVGRDSLRAPDVSLLVDDRGADVASGERQTALLRRIATETGGRFYALDDVDALADDVAYTDAGITVRDAKDLWDMPAVLLLLLSLLGAEWGYRRWRGLT